MAYRDDNELKHAVRDLVATALADQDFKRDIVDRVFREAWNKVETRLTKETRVVKHLIWAAFLGLTLTFVYFGFTYYTQMSSPEGRCEEACQRVQSVSDDSCVCRPPEQPSTE